MCYRAIISGTVKWLSVAMKVCLVIVDPLYLTFVTHKLAVNVHDCGVCSLHMIQCYLISSRCY